MPPICALNFEFFSSLLVTASRPHKAKIQIQ